MTQAELCYSQFNLEFCHRELCPHNNRWSHTDSETESTDCESWEGRFCVSPQVRLVLLCWTLNGPYDRRVLLCLEGFG